MELSEPTRALLDSFLEVRGDVALTAQDALRLFLGTNGGLVRSFSDFEVLQLVALAQQDALEAQYHEIQGLELALKMKPGNRAQRRHQKT